MAIVTDGLVNNLDASVLLLSGFSDGQSLLNAFIPDEVDTDGWYGSAGYSCYIAASGQYNYPVMRFYSGNLTFQNPAKFLNYENLTVQIAAKRTGLSYSNTWMGLFSTWFNYAKSGLTILAITDNANTRDFTGWGTYGGITTIQSTSAMPLNEPVIVTATITPATSGNFYTNGVFTGEFNNSKSQAYFGVGGLESARGFFVGDIYQVLIYNKILNSSEIIENTETLRDKWFLPPSSL